MSDEFVILRPGGRRVVQDELLIRSEIYNPNAFDVVFFRDTEKDQYTRESGITVGPQAIVCKSREFCVLPTSFYTVRAYDKGHAGDSTREVHISPGEYSFIRNYGDQIGKNNVLPSVPELEVRKRR